MSEYKRTLRPFDDFDYSLNGRCVINYEPTKENAKKRNNPWWIIADVDYNISNYYSWWVQRMILNPPWATNGIKLHPPMWGTHITVLDGRNEVQPEYHHLWKKYHGKIINFNYSPDVQQIHKFWVIPVKCKFLMNIRKELGIDDPYPLHITIGRIL